MAPKPQILVLTPYPLLPATSGGRLYAVSTVRPLADEVDFHLLALANADERRELVQGGDGLLAEYRRLFRSVEFEERPPIPTERKSRLRVLRHFAVHVARGLPLMDLSYYQPRAIARARAIVARQRIDLLEVHHLHCAFYRPFLRQVPALLINHNIEADLWPFWPLAGGHAIERWFWERMGVLSRRYAHRIEIENAFGFAAKLFISSSDMARVPEGPCPRFFLPMSVELDRTPRSFHADRFVVLWIGGFFWDPNVEAVTWLLDEIWPLVRAGSSVPVELHVVGAGPPPALRARHDGREVFIHGQVPDVDPFRRRADALVAPLRAGGGVRIKIVEALNAGVPVVATTKGCEGLPLRDGESIRVADDAVAFAAALLQLQASIPLRERLSAAGRDFCASHHSPEAVRAVKRQVYASILGARGLPAPGADRRTADAVPPAIS